ncbi:hypothetical protein KKC1_26640 [Calderihabitans maritimus]|uniref:Uncharacterized protein n=1 Tax=Calderihabitans maritimus TaxID=1246530 RepID=A0A1Z5HVG5_9FIRM|nr:hypothetical protein KKC1_26640 [Calderihabitans maritimus]
MAVVVSLRQGCLRRRRIRRKPAANLRPDVQEPHLRLAVVG